MLQALQSLGRMPPRSADGDKVVHFMRHGQTQMNAYLEDSPSYGTAGFTDPLLCGLLLYRWACMAVS